MAGEAKQPANMPFYLTQKDRKRVRRQQRAEREREKQDKIQLGLMPPPEPKFKLSNFMKVLGEQAVADPSKLEKRVMEQVRGRLTKHEMRNRARKLTPQEKKEKARRKLAEDTSGQRRARIKPSSRCRGAPDDPRRVAATPRPSNFETPRLCAPERSRRVRCDDDRIYSAGDVGGPDAAAPRRSGGVTVAVFYVASLASSQHRFKIDVNAQQLGLTGGVLICSAPDMPCALVTVEGGPRAVKRYVGLMTRRIDWADDAQLQANEAPNWCKQVWAGSVVKRAFAAFKFQECKSTLTARRVLDAKGVAHYWDAVAQAHNGGPPPAEDEDDE